MARGLFTQSTTVLFERAPAVDALEQALAQWSPVRRPTDEPSWISRSDELVIEFDPPNNGMLFLDRGDDPWPDGMGDPQTDPLLFGAWMMGAFGPLAYPGGLERAARQAIAFPNAASHVARHGGFVRLRTSYCIGAAPDAPVWPPGADSLKEIAVLLDVARAVVRIDGAIALFDPNGEVALPPAEVEASMDHAARHGVPALDLITHVRIFNVEGSGFALMDTVGMGRFFLPDAELALAPEIDPNHGAAFLRNLSLHHIRRGAAIPDGHTTDGPGGRYAIHHRETSLSPPPREVVRVVPTFADAPEDFLAE